MSECGKCGTSDRYADGRCKACTRESNQRWKAAHRGQHRAGSAKWQAENPEAVRAKGRNWARKNQDGRAQYKRSWRVSNPTVHRAHQQLRRARKLGAGGSYTAAEWHDLCRAYGMTCLRCRSSEVKLTVDHVIPLSAGGRNDISNIQPLCGPCNSAKGTQATDYRTRSQRSAAQQLALFEEGAA